jgi:hypothetical protein
MADKALSQQVLAEHEILMHVTNALRTVLDWQDRDYDLSRKLSSLRFTTESFQRHLERLMSLEEHHGYMEAIAESRPDLHAEVETLHKDHEEIRRSLKEIVHGLETLTPVAHAGYARASESLSRLLERVERHGNREAELLEQALL